MVKSTSAVLWLVLMLSLLCTDTIAIIKRKLSRTNTIELYLKALTSYTHLKMSESNQIALYINFKQPKHYLVLKYNFRIVLFLMVVLTSYSTELTLGKLNP